MPHFQQVVSLAETMAASRSAEALLHGHLDRWPCGLVVCDTSGEVHWLNQKARTQLNAGNGLFLRDGVLKASRRAVTAAVGKSAIRPGWQHHARIPGDTVGRSELAPCPAGT